ncbi:MAG: hypothetical protein HPY66_3048 [Firmicutes bacterium]|nr:hypothetical protein [Bacillota bacterium]
MKKVVAVILIITGIALIAYPKLREAYYDHKQEQLLREWENSMALPELQDTGEAGEDEEGVVEDNEQAETAEKMLERMRYIEENMEGMLKEVIKKDVSYVYEVFEKLS